MPPCLRLLPNFSSRLLPSGGLSQLQGSPALCKRLSIYFLQEKKKKTPHTQPIPAVERGALHTQSRSPSLPKPAPGLRARPNRFPALVLAPLHVPELGSRGCWRGKNPVPSPLWCLGVSASVPRHQVPEGITKSTPATGKREPKVWGPSSAEASQAAPRKEEARGTKGARESLVSRPSAQPSLEEKQPQPSRANLGAGGILQPWE